MKNIKNLKINKKGIIALSTASIILLSGIGVAASSLLKKKDNETLTNSVEPEVTTVSYAEEENLVSSTKRNISNVFPEMNDEIITDSTLILLLDLLAKENENGKVSADTISNFKSKIDSDNMMEEFNALLDVLENTMITQNKFISMSNTLPREESTDIAILSNIESIASTIIYLSNNGGNKDQIVNEYNKIYDLFVNEDEVLVNGKKFEVRDLSYANRAIASAYARTVGYFAREYVSEESLSKLDARTNDQNSKAYIKTKLEILSNQMNEVSEIDVNKAFNNKYTAVSNLLNGKIELSQDSVKNLVNYSNLKYLDSDKVSTKDKKDILVDYEDSKVSDAITSIDAMHTYNLNNQKGMILFSDLLIDDYKNTDGGKVDKTALDFVQYNAIKLTNTVKEGATFSDVYNNPYFQNIYKYFTKQDFTHKTKDANGNVVETNVIWQEISDSTNFVCGEIINYTLNRLPKVDYMDQYIEKSQTNLTESIQYIQNTVTGECEKVEASEFVKTK